jgi:hypothetical protein
LERLSWPLVALPELIACCRRIAGGRCPVIFRSPFAIHDMSGVLVFAARFCGSFLLSFLCAFFFNSDPAARGTVLSYRC